MSEFTNNRPDAARGQGVKVALAATAASGAVVAFWVSDNMPVIHADRWQDAAIVAGALAAWLTWIASKQTPQHRAEARAGKEQRARIAEASRLLRMQSKRAEAGTAKKAETSGMSSLEAERLRLLKTGFTQQEASQILIARASGSGTEKPSFGSGVATGVLNNLDAVVTHLRSLIPSVKADLTQLLDQDADSATRISGAVSLGVKTAAAIVVGFFVYLEALQVRASAYKAWADACISRQQAEINYSTMSELMSGAGNNLNADCKNQ